MPQQEVNGISIHYNFLMPRKTAQSSHIVVLVNGLADDQSTWASQATALTEAGFTVLCYDNRGVGHTSAPEGPYTSGLLAKDLHGLLSSLEIKQFHLVGISMGGMIGQSYALDYPNGSDTAQGLEMLSLSLCCTYAEPTEFCSRMFRLWADMAVKMSVQDVMRDVVLWCFTVPFFRERSGELQEVDDAMEALDMSTQAYLAQLNVIQVFDSTHQLKELTAQGKALGNLQPARILVLAGEQDILIPTQLSKELQSLISGAQWKTVKGGHCCALEFADEFNETLLAFLSLHS